MRKSGVFQTLRAALMVSLLGLTCLSSWAARDFTPQSGTWMVYSEIDGKPGRGLAIDVQGNTFFMQVFGYEKNGDATFYTATGQMEGNSVTAPLMRYKNGRSLGGPMQDAIEDRSVGQVTLNFSNGIRGTLQFPGESEVEIRRLLVSGIQDAVTNPEMQLGERTLRLFTLDSRGKPNYATLAKLWRQNGQTYVGWYRPDATGEISYAPQFQCNVSHYSRNWQCIPLNIPFLESKPAEIADIESMDLRMAGFDVQGTLHIGGKQPQTRAIIGFDEGATLRDTPYREGNTTIIPEQQQAYVTANFDKEELCQVTCVASSKSHLLMPMNGTWVVEDELTGKPGRGIALDVQGRTVIMQVFNYRPDGQPTFHMGFGTYESKGLNSRASVASVVLQQYRGGRSLGGSPQSGELAATAGTATLEFSSPQPADGALDQNIWWTQGQLQLPGEAPVKIRRLQIDAPSGFAERMFGEWFIPRTESVVRFDRVQGDAVTTADGQVFCQPGGIAPGSNVSCGQRNGDLWLWHSSLYLPDMGRFGPFQRLRDRFGNSVGVGAVK